MSTLLYEALTNQREIAAPGTLALTATTTSGEETSKPATKLLDSVAALVPIEVIAAHAALLGLVSTSTDPSAGPVVVTITDPAWAKGFWLALVVAAALFYAIPHKVKGGWDNWDWLRMLIPSMAFVAWTMLQPGSLFDAVDGWSHLEQGGVAVFLGLVALLLSTTLSDKADEKGTGQAGAAAPAAAPIGAE